MKTALLIIEWLLLFVGVPLFAWSDFYQGSKLLIFVLPVAYSALIYFHYRPDIRPVIPRYNLYLGSRTLAGLVFLFLLALWLVPDGFMFLPREKQDLWLLILVLYPLISALPQEFYFRRFYFWRYERLFRNQWLLMISSALTFMFIHIVYDNWVAILLTLAGGLLFSFTYMQTRRLSLCWIEHSIYGLAIFTAGLERFLYEPVA